MSDTFVLVASEDDPRDFDYLITKGGSITEVRRSRLLPTGVTLLIDEQRILSAMDSILERNV